MVRLDETLGRALFVAVITLTILTAVIGVLLVATLRHMAFLFEVLDPVLRFSTRVSVLRVGQQPPPLALEEVKTGVSVEQPSASSGFRFLLVIQPRCKPCELLVRESAELLLSSPAHGWTPLVVILGDRDGAMQLIAELEIPREVATLLDPSLSTIRAWGIQATPYGVALDERGAVRGTFSMLTSTELAEVLGRPGRELRAPRRLPVSPSPVEVIATGKELQEVHRT